MIGMEGGHSIDNSLATLRMLHALGAGYMTLTHSANVPWADSATDKPVLGGLSKFGEEVVREMNWLGMLVDLSHVSPDTMEDAIRVSEAPVIFSHSSAKAICNVPRNVPDNVLQMLPKNGGVVMITFVPGFISQAVADHGAKSQAAQQSFRAQFPNNEAYVGAAMERWRAENPEPRATLSQVADHIDHVRKIAGIDHIGLGGDFDGITHRRAGTGGRVEVSRPDRGAPEARLHRSGHQEDSRPERPARDARGRARVGGAAKKRGPSTATIERDGLSAGTQ